MMRTDRAARFVAAGLGMVLGCGMALATPSTQIWIPSTDIQGYKTLHLGIDNYVRASDKSDGTRDPNIFDAGLTYGLLALGKVGVEVGVDYIAYGNAYDDDPVYFNAKLGLAENALGKLMPALAIGGYGFGTNGKEGSATRTDQDIVYGLVAKTLPLIGRLSAGYYIGNEDVLVGTDGDKANDGVLLSWDRALPEISEKLWAAVDYQGGDNALGALSFGVAWSFSKNVSVIAGYDIYNEKRLAGEDTVTLQLDINL